MKKLSIYVAIAAVLAIGTAYASGVRSWPFSAPTVNGSSSVANPEAGNIIFDVIATAFKGYDGTTWVTFGGGGSTLPIGTIIAFGGTSAPTGFLIANGAAVSRTTYSELYTAIGDAFGAGDGVNTFNLPDLRGRFMRGVDDGEANDPDAAGRIASNTGGNTGDSVGSLQADAIRNITGSVVTGASHLGNLGASGAFATQTGSSGLRPNFDVSASRVQYNFDASTMVPTGGDNRPKNVYVNYIIKH